MSCNLRRRSVGAALLLGAVAVQGALASGTTSSVSMEARSSLAQPGWVNPVPAPQLATSTQSGVPAAVRTLAAELSLWPNLTYYNMASAVAEASAPDINQAGAPVSTGVSAAARAIATAAGAASARASAKWNVAVVINPFASAGPIFGQAMYQRLLERFDCDSLGQCQTVDFTTTFQHQSTGRFLHSVQPFHEGTANFSESVRIQGLQNNLPVSATIAGSASYTVRQSPTGNQLVGELSPSGDWTDGDFDPIAPSSNLQNLSGPMFDTGPLGGERLFSLRQVSLTTGFDVVSVGQLGGLKLPGTLFQLDIEQSASAGFRGPYGWGSVAADFDDTALSSVYSLVDPLGEFDFDPSMLQVYVTAVPEPSKLALWAVGLCAVVLARARQRAGAAQALG